MYDEYGMYVDNDTVEELEKGILMTVTDPHYLNGEHAIFCQIPMDEVLLTKIFETKELGNVNVPWNTNAHLEKLYGSANNCMVR